MTTIGNRFYFVCVLLSTFYVIIALKKIIDTTETYDFGGKSEYLNRSIVAAVLNSTRYCRTPRVAVLISPNIEQLIHLYWDVEYVKEDDWVALFDKDPQTNRETFPIYTVRVENSTGYITTNITTNKRSVRELKYQSECLDYWAIYFNNDGTVVAVSCMKTQPTWMYDKRFQLGDVLIKNMFIPGTHDSGSYITIDDLTQSNVVNRYVYTQDEDVLTQLMYGIRYLDLRVSSNTELEERWWLNHGIVRVHPLQVIIDDIKKFLRKTNEIIIVDFHEFPIGFTENVQTHYDLVNYIKSELSEWMAPPNWNATCGQLWRMNKTLIVSYNDENIVKQYPSLLWNAVTHKWANAQDVNDLKNYFNKVIESRPSRSWAAMAELTPTLWTILTQQTGGLRHMASNVNVHVTNWFRGVWGKTCNIVAVDFFRGSDIIDAAIEWNLRKFAKHICDIR